MSKPTNPRFRIRITRRLAGMFLPVLFAFPGCAVNVNEIVFQAVDAAARTWIDLLLTDLVNDLAGAPTADGI